MRILSQGISTHGFGSGLGWMELSRPMVPLHGGKVHRADTDERIFRPVVVRGTCMDVQVGLSSAVDWWRRGRTRTKQRTTTTIGCTALLI